MLYRGLYNNWNSTNTAIIASKDDVVINRLVRKMLPRRLMETEGDAVWSVTLGQSKKVLYPTKFCTNERDVPVELPFVSSEAVQDADKVRLRVYEDTEYGFIPLEESFDLDYRDGFEDHKSFDLAPNDSEGLLAVIDAFALLIRNSVGKVRNLVIHDTENLILDNKLLNKRFYELIKESIKWGARVVLVVPDFNGKGRNRGALLGIVGTFLFHGHSIEPSSKKFSLENNNLINGYLLGLEHGLYNQECILIQYFKKGYEESCIGRFN